MTVTLPAEGTFRTRKVLLDGPWYDDDAGTLLGFLLEDGEDVTDNRSTPVTLSPSHSGYRLYRAGHAPVRVTKAIADRLHPEAYQVYTALPVQSVGLRDVLRVSFRGSERDSAFVLVLGLVGGALSMSIPLLTGRVFDDLVPSGERGQLLALATALAVVFVGQALFDVARGLAVVRVEARMDATLEGAVWDRLLDLPLSFFRAYAAGELASRAAAIARIRDVVAATTLTAILGGVFSLWNFGFLFVLEPRLAVAATALVAVALVPAAVAAHRGLLRERAVAELDGTIEGLLLALFQGIATVRVAAAESRAFAIWATLFARRRNEEVAGERIRARAGVMQTVYPVVCSMVLYVVVAPAEGPRVSTGTFLAFASAFGLFLTSTLAVVEAVLRSLAVVPLYERARPILEAKGERHAGGDRPNLEGRIELNHVSFRYDVRAPLALDDVSIDIAPGEFVALVGPSGSGKSTLLRLLLGFDAPTSGGVFYDGRALTGLDVPSVRRQIGVVTQSSRVLSGDIYSNIVGATGLSHDDAWKAARRAALAEDIEAMPMGMSTVITPGGGMLSGGQRQRLLIARALATNPRIVLFDEATSALDNLTQAAVRDSLARLRSTRVVIAHRLSTIRDADKIVVLEQGRVVQVGKYEDLAVVEGPFKRLAERQAV